MKKLFYLVASMLGIHLNGMGSYQMTNAIAGFEKAKNELEAAINISTRSTLKLGSKIEDMRAELVRKESMLKSQIAMHDSVKTQSEKYLKKFQNFLDIDNESEN